VTDEQRLIVRVALLGVLTVVTQIAAVSQVPVLGVSADITPLVVMAIGLLVGSMTGAVSGFAIGLFLDLALVETVGVHSLLLLTIGYWAGRLRELRDPSHSLVPLAAGAAASAVAAVGFSVFQFLLGVDAPVSLLLVRQILVVTLLGALLALPVHAFVRRVLRSCLPEERRRRRRRPGGSTGVLSPLTSSSVRPRASR
jgi:rod shape-determining protein MreD